MMKLTKWFLPLIVLVLVLAIFCASEDMLFPQAKVAQAQSICHAPVADEIAVATQGNTLVVVGSDEIYVYRQSENGELKLVQEITRPQEMFDQVKISPDENKLAWVIYTQEGLVTLQVVDFNSEVVTTLVRSRNLFFYLFDWTSNASVGISAFKDTLSGWFEYPVNTGDYPIPTKWVASDSVVSEMDNPVVTYANDSWVAIEGGTYPEELAIASWSGIKMPVLEAYAFNGIATDETGLIAVVTQADIAGISMNVNLLENGSSWREITPEPGWYDLLGWKGGTLYAVFGNEFTNLVSFPGGKMEMGWRLPAAANYYLLGDADNLTVVSLAKPALGTEFQIYQTNVATGETTLFLADTCETGE